MTLLAMDSPLTMVMLALLLFPFSALSSYQGVRFILHERAHGSGVNKYQPAPRRNAVLNKNSDLTLSCD